MASAGLSESTPEANRTGRRSSAGKGNCDDTYATRGAMTAGGAHNLIQVGADRAVWSTAKALAADDSETRSMPRFCFDGDDAVFTAQGTGPNWNGWVVPIVDRETLAAVVSRMNERDSERTTELVDVSAGAVIVYEFEWDDEGRELVSETTVTPDSNGNYLLDIGLTLVEVDRL